MFRSLIILYYARLDTGVLVDPKQRAFHATTCQRSAGDRDAATSEPPPIGSVPQRAIHAR